MKDTIRKKVGGTSVSTNKQLTSAELGKLWVTYSGNTLGKCVLQYFLKHVNDEKIKEVVQDAHDLSVELLEKLEQLFHAENIPIPKGMTEEDVNEDAPRLFLDDFYLHYLRYTSKAGLSIYSIAIPLMTREDVREFFINGCHATMKLITKINKVMLDKGLLIKPPIIPYPEHIDFVKKQSFLYGFLGDVRSLHALEIAHLYDNIDNKVTSKALLIGFSQCVQDEDVRQFMLRGKTITERHLRLTMAKLHKNHLPSPTLLDDMVTSSTVAPFSDKLMLSHKIDMFSMKIRSYANALSLGGRRDIGGLYAKFMMDVTLFIEDGGNKMIDRGWLEQPPKAFERK